MADFSNYNVPADLKFHTKDIIKSGGFNCFRKLDTAVLDKIVSPAKVIKAEIDIEFSVSGQDILAQGQARLEKKLTCDRCLGEFVKKDSIDFFETFSMRAPIIDIMEVLLKEVALTNEISNFCDKNCKGLCRFCGQNLNEKQCGCKDNQPKPFSMLKDKFGKDKGAKNA